MLLGYPKGYPMIVTYLHRQSPNIDVRSMIIDIAIEEDVIHEDFTRILNLEMKLESSLSFDMQEEDKATQLTGSAIMYPGLEPYEGDMFFLEVDNNNIVLFIINTITPTTYRQERFYRVSFNAYQQITKPLYDRLMKAVTETCVFEKKKYFGESELTFLSTESWKQLKELEQLRRSIAQDIVNFFFSKDIVSFIRPDGIYDPYVTEFLRRKLTVQHDRIRATQLVVPLLDFHRSLWYKFIDAENVSDLSDLAKYAVVNRKDPQYYSVDFNGLTGKYYLQMSDTPGNGLLPLMDKSNSFLSPRLLIHRGCGNSRCNQLRSAKYPQTDLYSVNCHLCPKEHLELEEATYLFSKNFYLGYIDSGTAELESVVSDYLRHHHKLNVERVLDMTVKYRKLGRGVDAFYHLPIYLELVDAAIVAIK